jgi:hypothetical protein
MTAIRAANQPTSAFDAFAAAIVDAVCRGLRAAVRRAHVRRVVAQLRHLDPWVLEDVGLYPWQIPGLAEALVDGVSEAVPVGVPTAIVFVPGRLCPAANDVDALAVA